MKISLIGMSGAGKSYWSKKLAENGFQRFCCDDLIEKKLGAELTKLGYRGIEDVAKWMGQPYDKQYKETSKRYLELEQQVLEELLELLEKADEKQNIVIDTTGSVIYLDPTILKKLSRLTNVIFLDTPETVKQEMYQLYIKEPKPVIWGQSFIKKNNETDLDALKRCYPQLLAYRTEQYERLAKKKFDYFELRKPEFTLNHFSQKIVV